MGGGGVIRTVGKLAGIGATSSRGFRGVHPSHLAEQSARGVSRNVPAIVSSNNGSFAAGDVSPVAVQRPALEIDDWELAGGEGDLVMSKGKPMPRVVFGAPPTFQEAKAATDELKDALEKVYLSSPAAADTASSMPLGHSFVRPFLSNSDAESKHLVFTEADPAPKHAIQAFKMLSQSTAAQNVVASIASDPNVYNAVLQNEALMDFLQAQKATSVDFPPEDPDMKSLGEGEIPEDGIATKTVNESTGESKTVDSANGFMSMFQNVKYAVEDMVSKVSGFVQNKFSPKVEEKENAENGEPTFMEAILGKSFLGLAVMAILVVLLKRA